MRGITDVITDIADSIPRRVPATHPAPYGRRADRDEQGHPVRRRAFSNNCNHSEQLALAAPRR
jgi:hypothetical protein